MLNKETKIALLVGGVVTIGAVALIAAKQTSGIGKYFLQIQASEGGTTDPSPSPSGIYKNPNETVTIRAIPSSGYTVGTWILDGSEIGSQESIQVTMNMNHTVVVTFWQGGVPPPSYPVAIIAPTTTALTGYYLWTVELGALNIVKLTKIHYTDRNWNMGNYQNYPVTFKVIDANGRGVPNVDVNLYPDQFPDNSKYRGYIATNDQSASASNPLRLPTDSNGYVTVNLSYWYGISILNDAYLTLSKDAEIHVDGLGPILPGSWNPYDGWNGVVAGTPFGVTFTGKGGDKIVPPNPTLNYMIARIPGTSIPQAQAVLYCQFHTKML